MSEHALRVALSATLSAADALESASDELCQLDAVAGDGDHGLAMAAAARAIREELDHRTPADVGELAALVAKSFSAVGGSMGAISSVLVEAVGVEVTHLDAPLSAAQVARLLAAAEDAVAAFGGATRGDKTIVDAIAPAREAAESSAERQRPAAEALMAAAAAAEEGVASTAQMTARIGRASRLGDISLGAVDPGAASFAIALAALAHSYARDVDRTTSRASSIPVLGEAADECT